MKNLKSLWPVWLPCPTAWAEALILALMMIPLGYSVEQFLVIKMDYLTATKNLGPLTFMLVCGYVLPFIGFSYVHSFLWGNRPTRWPRELPAPRSIFEGFYALSTNVVASLAVIIILMFLGIETDYTEESLERVSTIVGIIWLIVTAYLCQTKRWVWQGMVSEIKTKLEKDRAAGLDAPPRKKYT